MTANRLFDDIIQSFIRWSPPSYNWWHSRQNSIMVYRFVLQRSYWSYPVLPRSMYFEYLLRNCLPTTAIGASPSCYLPIAMGGEGRRGFIYWCKCHICAIKKKIIARQVVFRTLSLMTFHGFPFFAKILECMWLQEIRLGFEHNSPSIYFGPLSITSLCEQLKT